MQLKIRTKVSKHFERRRSKSNKKVMKNDKKKKLKAKNRQTKSILVFDEKDRRDFLTGFHKRKEARKKRAKELTEELIKKERKELKQTKKEFLERKLKHQYVPPDLEELEECQAKKEVKELPHHTVTVTDISEVDLAGQGGLRLGRNQGFEDKKSDSESETGNTEDISQNKKQSILRKMEFKINKRSRHLKVGHSSHKKHKKTLSKKMKHRKKPSD